MTKDDLISRQAAIDAMSNALERVFPEHRAIAERTMNKLPSVSTGNKWQKSGAQHLEDIANGKFNEPYTCVAIKIGNETKHVCVVNCSSICHNPRYACEKNKNICPSCGAKMQEVEE